MRWGKQLKGPSAVAIAAGAAMLVALPAAAGTLTFDFNIEFSGGTPPAGTAPWISATFDDSFGGPNTVRLTMSTANLVGQEFVGSWYFNFDPALDPTLLSIVGVDTTAVGATTIGLGTDAFKADGDGKYDILFDFPPPPGAFAGKFTAGETVVYDITYVSPIDVSSFDFDSAPDGGHGPFRSAAHVQGIGPDGEDSGWVAPGNGRQIPEPAALLILGAGLLGLGMLRRRTQR